MTKLDAALEWAGRGFRVFPLQPGGKKPLYKGWTTTASADPLEICGVWERDPEANIGVLTDDMIVVDIDMKNGKDGVASYKALGLPTDTLMVRTPTGGFHAYFTGPSVSLSAGRLGEGLDVRSYHGYVIAPGSEVDGIAYSVVVEACPKPAPVSLVDRLQGPRERTDAHLQAVGELDGAQDVARALAFLRARRPAVEGSGGDQFTYETICACKDFGVSESVAFDLLLEEWNERCLPPWDRQELQVKVQNAYLYGTSPAGVNSLAEALEAPDYSAIPQQPVTAPRSTRWLDHGAHSVTEVAWLFHRLLPAAGTAFLTAPSGTGKTFLMLELARCVATGKPFFGIEPDDRGGVIFVFAGSEGSGMGPRMEALGEQDPIALASTGVNSLRTVAELQTLATDILLKGAELKATFGVPLRLVIVETLSACGIVEDENNSTDMAAAVNALAGLSKAVGALVLTTHHPGKTGVGERGSGALRNSADYMLTVEEDGVRKRLDLTKARDAETRTVGAFTLLNAVVGKDDRGRDITTKKISMSGQSSIRVGPPRHADFFDECYDLCDKVGLADGKEAVELQELEAVFKDRFKGSRDRSNIRKVFKQVFEWSESVGAIRQVSETGRLYIVKGKFDVEGTG